MVAGIRVRPRARSLFFGLGSPPPVDLGTPGPPVNVAAVPVSSTAVAVTWGPPAGYSGIAGYRVFRDEAIIATVTGTGVTDIGLTAGATYIYQVVAVNLASAASPAVSATATTPTTTTDTTPPSVPTGVAATALSSTSARVTWTASTDAGGIGKYQVLRGGVVVAEVTTTTYTDVGLAASTTYSYSVRAVDTSGNTSAASASASVTTLAGTAPDTTPPTAPTGLTATATSATTIALAWSASTDNVAVTGYRVSRDGVQIIETTARTFIDAGRTPGATHSYVVRAVDAAANVSAPSSAASATTPAALDTTPPTAPTGLTATTTSSTTVALSWTAATDNVAVVRYQVFRGTLLVTETGGLSHTAAGLAPSTAYTFTVKAVDGAGNISTASNTASATTSAASGGSDPFAQAPAVVASYGPNGTHWPPDTPWYRSTTIPNVVDVDCTWAAIKTAIQSFTPVQVDAGAMIRVRPGTLPGNGASAGSPPAVQQAGSDQWVRRILIRPRDGYGTVVVGAAARIHEVRGVCFAGFTGQTLTLSGCINTAVAWSSLFAIRILGQGGTKPNTTQVTGYPTTRCDCYEVVVPDVTVGDVDPAGTGSGYPGPAGTAGGNGWIWDCRVVGCYIAPQYLPVDAFDAAGKQTAGFGHNDSWQQYGSSIYWGQLYEDTALWGSNNSAAQIGGFAGSNLETDVQAKEAIINAYYGNPAGTQIAYFLRLKHTILVDAGTGELVRYPRPAGTKPFTVTSAINGGGAPRRMDIQTGCIFKGAIYASAIWRSVSSDLRYWPATASTIAPGGGTWPTPDSSVNTMTAAGWNALSPIPTDEYLTSIWT